MTEIEELYGRMLRAGSWHLLAKELLAEVKEKDKLTMELQYELEMLRKELIKEEDHGDK